MGTIMTSPRPRSKASRSPRSPAWGGSKGERARRSRPLTWRSALLLLVPLALMAAGADVALYRFVSDHYARHGHLGVPLDIAAAALGFTAATAYGAVAFWREMRKHSGSTKARKPPDAATKNRATREPP